MVQQTDERLDVQVAAAALRQKINDLIAARSTEPEEIDRTLYELSRLISRLAVGEYPGELMRVLWDDYKRLAQYRQAQRSTLLFIAHTQPATPPPSKPVTIRDPLLLKMLARMNGERVRLTPKERRELTRRREMRLRIIELEPPVVPADRPRALPDGDHPVAQALARLNALT